MKTGSFVAFTRLVARPAGCEGLTQRQAVRVARGSLLAFLLGVGTGCYSFPVVTGTPSPGTRVVLQLNDQGRAALGERIGPSASLVDGTLQSVPDSAYPLRVMAVDYLNGQSNKWNGEALTISKSYVSVVKQREFSRSRSFLLAAAAAGAALAFILTRGILGKGSPDPDPTPGGGGPQS